jgi:hypothetical protein
MLNGEGSELIQNKCGFIAPTNYKKLAEHFVALYNLDKTCRTMEFLDLNII